MIKVSVIMGVCYRREDLTKLDRAVRSILEQTYRDFEFLICEYGSTQAAQQYLRELVLDDNRVKLINGTAPGSLAQNLNKCLENAKGQYIARMDDDDYSHPERFDRQLRYLAENLDAAFVGSNVALVLNGEVIGVRYLPEKPEVKDFYLTQPYIHPALMFRKETLEAVGGYNESKSCLLCEDYDLLLRMYEHGLTGRNIKEVLFDYTIPMTAKGNRSMGHRWNETVTRWKRFKALKQFPKALPYVVKPLLVGMLPEKMLAAWKQRQVQHFPKET